jgi:hypothetical protein
MSFQFLVLITVVTIFTFEYNKGKLIQMHGVDTVCNFLLLCFHE